ncbi:acetaldehyde dehydrogenase (acetylating) [Desulfobaculum bizertense]|uniref:Acetaldehyde dehydrogenase n=1 Tax=Desulfobaculum bizertense DSM 18034 TaxID=1121442 RepID=A0A1T4W660_9BACT|nr:acetaldehyde dehydrogenase (acetylating) [Desulfobaculum bizertense]UIJ38666.1 acetaldehyde dehydrogenase (acetylating) [Desulfobaculum bizertense]SKA72201.1 acetaldehyde dehydrogenase [Desulfobaculum bizertense DSM 18034]
MVDKDLLSIQEARTLVRAARVAQEKFAELDQARVDAVVEAVAKATAAHAEELGQLAHEETGYGKTQDKKVKNLLASERVAEVIRDMKTIGILNDDKEQKIVEVAVPVGVIAGIVPSTNPTSTTIYKTLISLKSGNAVVFTPHPSAKKCIGRTVEIIRGALKSCGVCEDLISVMSVPTIGGSGELMKIADLILATGGPGMVKAAYSSGTPALGVGAGNVPAFVERSADVKEAVARIFESKTFDNGTICASEQSIVTETVIEAQVRAEVVAQGGYFLEGDDLAKVKAIMERANGSMNPAIVGRDAKYIASLAGISVPANTRLLVSDEKGVGKKFPFSKEKLTGLLGFYVVEDWKEACELCHALLKNCGIGHSLAIHSKNEDVIRQFGLKKPVSRILVNTPSTQGAVGITTSLFPSFTLGCGTVGGSATSDNVTPLNLMNVRRVAYDLGNTPVASAPSSCASSASESCGQGANLDVNAITAMILEQLKKMA